MIIQVPTRMNSNVDFIMVECASFLCCLELQKIATLYPEKMCVVHIHLQTFFGSKDPCNLSSFHFLKTHI